MPLTIDSLGNWSWSHLALAAVLFLGTFTLSLAAVTAWLVLLPADFFAARRKEAFADRHPAVRILLRGVKNLLGVGLIVLGLALSLPGIPGQGLLTILVGVVLVDIPGKRRIERHLVARPTVQRSINRLRRRFGRPPMELGDPAQCD